jgi:radical SAM protein with 4Fe4S-binding SPASM domain
MALILDPRLHIRRDVNRVVIYPRIAHEFDDNDFVYFLHPLDAILLVLFDGKRSESDVAAYWGSLLNVEKYDAERYLKSFLSKQMSQGKAMREFLVEGDCLHRKSQYKITNFLIPETEINLQDRRCQIPIKFYFLPTMNCATNCIYCYNDLASGRGKPILSLARIEELLIEARSLDIFNIVFSGGDPFCRRDIFNILETMKTLNMHAQIPTKSPLDKSQIMNLKNINDTVELQISIDALNPTMLDAIVGVPGYHEKIVRTLRNLSDIGIPVRTNSVLMPCNVKDSVNLIEFLAGLGNVYRIQITPYGRSLYRHNESMFLEQSMLREFENEIATLRAKYPNITINFSAPVRFDEENQNFFESKEKAFSKRALCTAGLWGFILLPDGQVTACEEFCWHPKFIMGDLREQSIMDMWVSAKTHFLFSQPKGYFVGSICETCTLFNECIRGLGRCIRDTMKAYGLDNDNYPDPHCPIAPAGLRIV